MSCNLQPSYQVKSPAGHPVAALANEYVPSGHVTGIATGVAEIQNNVPYSFGYKTVSFPFKIIVKV